MTSPNYPERYPSDSDCTLAIDGGLNARFKIKFAFFEIEDDEDSKLTKIYVWTSRIPFTYTISCCPTWTIEHDKLFLLSFCLTSANIVLDAET